MPILRANPARRYELRVARRAYIVVSRPKVGWIAAGALVTVIAGGGGLYGVVADIAGRGEGEKLEGAQVVDARAGENTGCRGHLLAVSRRDWWVCRFVLGFVGHWEEGVGARFALIDAGVTEAPIAFVACSALPVALVCPGRAVAAEYARL